MEDLSKEPTMASLRKNVFESLTRIKSKSSARIYRVPLEHRQVKESAYMPSFVSIGPLHSRDQHLQSHAKDIKILYLNSLFLRVYRGLQRDVDKELTLLNGCVDEMEKSLLDVKKFYGEEEKDVKALNAQMLLVDGCFILELLCKHTERTKREEDEKSEVQRRKKDSSSQSSKSQKNNDERLPDPIFSFPLTRIAVQQDLILLENQLPFFVLQRLFDLTLGLLPGHLHLTDYILNYFHGILKIGHKKISLDGCAPRYQHEVGLEGKYDHILHFLHSHYIPSGQPDDVYGHNDEFMPSASRLDNSGVKFEGIVDEFKVQFDPRWGTCRRALLAIPTLHVDDSTELVLRNLIAFEKCLPGVSGYFASYASLMDRLINTEKDVQVLEEARVIKNLLGTSEKASDLFNNLCKEYVLEGFHFAETCKAVSCYNKFRCIAFLPITIQYLKRKWSANPWTFVGFCVALVVFVMQIIQFITSYT